MKRYVHHEFDLVKEDIGLNPFLIKKLLLVEINKHAEDYSMVAERYNSKSTIKDIIDFSKNISFSQCTTNKCKNIQFNDTTSNREGMCESCFLNKADIKYYGDLIKDSESAISNCENEISNGSLFVLETVIHSNCDDTVLYHFTKYKTDIHYINQLKEHYNADHIDYETTHIQDYLKSLKNELNIYETRKIKNKIKTF